LGWYKTTLAHNTFVQNEANQKAATGKLLSLKTGNGWSAALADAGPAYEGTTLRRAAFLLGSDTAVFVDSADQRAPGLLDLAIHPSFEPKAWLAQHIGAAVNLSPKPGYSYLKDSKTAIHISPYTDLASGFTLSLSPLATPTQYIVATGMGKSSEDRVPILLARTEATKARWVWMIAPQDTKLTAHTEGDTIHVAVSAPGKKTWQLQVRSTELAVKPSQE
jgi:hypothetical protein